MSVALRRPRASARSRPGWSVGGPRVAFAVGASAYAAAVLVGLLTRGLVSPQGLVVAPAWPATGAAVLWLAVATRPRPDRTPSGGGAEVGTVLVLTTVLPLFFGVGVGDAVALAVATTGQAVAVVALWWTVPIGSSQDTWLAGVPALARLTLAAVAGTFAGVLCLAGGRAFLDHPAPVPALLTWWAATLSGLTLLVPVGLLLTDRATGLGPVRRRTRPWDVVVVGVATLVVLAVVLLVAGTVPLGFLLVLTIALAALRLGAVGLNLHVALLGLLVQVSTLVGGGPFGVLDAGPDRVLLAHLFTVVGVGVALVLSLRGVERDRAVEEAREARLRAQDSAALFMAVLQNVAEGVAVVQADGAVLVRNPTGRRLLDLEGPPSPVVLTAEEYGLHRPDGTLLSDPELPFNRVLAGEDFLVEDYVSFSATGRRRLVQVRAVRMEARHSEDQPKAVMSFRDVTAERTDRDSLAAFAGVVAHDLINPLAVVRGWADHLADLLEDGAVSSEQGRPMVRLIQDASVGMMQMVDDLLAHTVARDAVLRPEDLDLSAMAEALASLHREGPRRAEVHVQPGLCAYADRTLVRQLVANLLGNAVKYVDHDTTPVVEVAGVEAGDRVVVEVRDNGIGVPEEARDRIFENFQRAHPGHAQPGTGLGLAICRQVVERHRGTLTCEPRPGGGTVFRFTLPAVAPHPADGVDGADGADGADGVSTHPAA